MSDMDYRLAVSKIYSDIGINPECFNFTEEEARVKKLWRDERPMPTREELQAALDKHYVEEDARGAEEKVRKSLMKDKNANTKDRFEALLNHLGLD